MSPAAGGEDGVVGLRVARRDRVAYVTLDRPARRNALSEELWDRLVVTFAELDLDDAVWAVVVTGAGDHAFCSGVDLGELGGPDAGIHRAPMRRATRNLFEVLLEVQKPTIAAINGPAVGAGFELAMACDLRVVADHAYFVLPEAKRGLGATFGAAMLPRLVPRGVAMEALYLGSPISAADAGRWGLANRVVPSADVPGVTEDVVRGIVANAPLTVRRYKHAVSKGLALPMGSAVRLEAGPDPYASLDRQEGVSSFLEGRTPRWTGT